jgi:hypothetical protein
MQQTLKEIISNLVFDKPTNASVESPFGHLRQNSDSKKVKYQNIWVGPFTHRLHIL